jgi:hypothetical protein
VKQLEPRAYIDNKKWNTLHNYHNNMKQAKQSETHPCHLMQWTCETYSHGLCIIELFVKQLEPRSYIDT